MGARAQCAPRAEGSKQVASHPRCVLREMCNEDPMPELSNGHLIALDPDAALSAAWVRRAGMISYLPSSARVALKNGAWMDGRRVEEGLARTARGAPRRSPAAP